jgi:hypothetical protein
MPLNKKKRYQKKFIQSKEKDSAKFTATVRSLPVGIPHHPTTDHRRHGRRLLLLPLDYHGRTASPRKHK